MENPVDDGLILENIMDISFRLWKREVHAA